MAHRLILEAVFKLTKSAMTAILLPFAAAIAACTPSPQESAMHSSSPGPGTTAEGSTEARAQAEEGGAPKPAARNTGSPDQAVVGPVPEPVSAAENPVPAWVDRFARRGPGSADLVHGLRPGGPRRTSDGGVAKWARACPSPLGHATQRLLRCPSVGRQSRRQILRRIRRSRGRPARWWAGSYGARYSGLQPPRLQVLPNRISPQAGLTSGRSAYRSDRPIRQALADAFATFACDTADRLSRQGFVLPN